MNRSVVLFLIFLFFPIHVAVALAPTSLNSAVMQHMTDLAAQSLKPSLDDAKSAIKEAVLHSEWALTDAALDALQDSTEILSMVNRCIQKNYPFYKEELETYARSQLCTWMIDIMADWYRFYKNRIFVPVCAKAVKQYPGFEKHLKAKITLLGLPYPSTKWTYETPYGLKDYIKKMMTGEQLWQDKPLEELLPWANEIQAKLAQKDQDQFRTLLVQTMAEVVRSSVFKESIEKLKLFYGDNDEFKRLGETLKDCVQACKSKPEADGFFEALLTFYGSSFYSPYKKKFICDVLKLLVKTESFVMTQQKQRLLAAKKIVLEPAEEKKSGSSGKNDSAVDLTQDKKMGDKKKKVVGIEDSTSVHVFYDCAKIDEEAHHHGSHKRSPIGAKGLSRVSVAGDDKTVPTKVTTKMGLQDVRSFLNNHPAKVYADSFWVTGVPPQKSTKDVYGDGLLFQRDCCVKERHDLVFRTPLEKSGNKQHTNRNRFLSSLETLVPELKGDPKLSFYTIEKHVPCLVANSVNGRGVASLAIHENIYQFLQGGFGPDDTSQRKLWVKYMIQVALKQIEMKKANIESCSFLMDMENLDELAAFQAEAEKAVLKTWSKADIQQMAQGLQMLTVHIDIKNPERYAEVYKEIASNALSDEQLRSKLIDSAKTLLQSS